jgi:ATP-dependent helicase HepA
LLDRMTFSDPDKRLMAGQVDGPEAWSLRLRSLRLRESMLGSRVRGLCGARLQLLPHQMGIAYEVASRHRPRVLLADEVGLGKTIEAGLIFHRLHVTGQVTRVLIVTPTQLVHQWLVEMYRRFNHMFTVVDEDLCRSEEKGKPGETENPFLQRQTMLCEAAFFAGSPRRVQQAMDAGIDLLIVDEAHHLAWSETAPSREYVAIEKLASVAKRVLLLTATPIQLGQAGHFARLRLLDPERFSNLADFMAETGRYETLAATLDRLLEAEKPDKQVAEELAQAFADDAALQGRLAEYLAGGAVAKRALIEDLIDRHGTGRLMFRNRRQALGGFPPRVVLPAPLEPSDEHKALVAYLAGRLPPDGERQLSEAELSRLVAGAPAFTVSDLPGFLESRGEDPGEFLRRAWRRDPRIDWLVDLLKRLEGEKILLIASNKNVVFALSELMPTVTTTPFSVFHENLTMTTRDRNAAWFADPAGAQILLCSEIGSEGRNFQFAHHLVLFDLPLDPSVLEQRIGRLDRIGQSADIHLHVPFIKGSAHEALYRWYADGLSAFGDTVLGADYVKEKQIGELLRVGTMALRSEAEGSSRGATDAAVPTEAMTQAAIESLCVATRDLATTLRATLEKGRDRLLEINSRRPETARALIAEIKAEDEDDELESYLEEVFDHFGLDIEETALKRGYFIIPGERMTLDSFPGISEPGLAMTFDRGEAMAREDVAFMSMDHPVMRGAVDLLLEGQEGTTGFVGWGDAPRKGMALEVVFILAATAPGDLHVDRFLPPTAVRVLVDGSGDSISDLLPRLDVADLEPAPTSLLEEHHQQFDSLVPKLLEAAKTQASFIESSRKKEAHKDAERRLMGEAQRLRDLSAVNPSVKPSDVEAAEAHAQAVLREITRAEMRLEGVRLVVMGRMAW